MLQYWQSILDGISHTNDILESQGSVPSPYNVVALESLRQIKTQFKQLPSEQEGASSANLAPPPHPGDSTTVDREKPVSTFLEMQAIKSAFQGANFLHYLSMASMATGLILCCIAMGGAWIRGISSNDCETFFYARSLTEDNCEGFTTGQYYAATCNGQSFCRACQDAGKGMLCLGVFGLIVGTISILISIKRALKDLSQDWAGRNLKKISVGVSMTTAVLFFLSWLVFLGRCEASLGEFSSSSPHTAFVLMFLAMCLAGFSMVCNLMAFDSIGSNVGRQSSAQGIMEQSGGVERNESVAGGDESVVDEKGVDGTAAAASVEMSSPPPGAAAAAARNHEEVVDEERDDEIGGNDEGKEEDDIEL